jgi:membrane-bound lytic murein transglycosylase D
MRLSLILFTFLIFPGISAQPPESYGNLDSHGAPSTAGYYPPLFYEVNIANMNLNSDIGLFYDERVQQYIDIYLTQRKDQLPQLSSLSSEYFPLFEKYLRLYNIPEEIKYLPIIESALNPKACSPSQAVGLWQFKKATAEGYGLKVTDQVDERTDPELSTIAACKYLSDLYRQFNDWHLALLAYNAGPAAVRRAILATSPEKSLHSLNPHLSLPAKNYLPALVAVIYLFNNMDNHF